MRFLSLVSIVALSVLGGCGQDETPAPVETKTFVVIANVASGDVEQGAKLAAKAAESAYKHSRTSVTVKVLGTGAAQVKELEGLATSGGVDGIAIDAVALPEVSAAIAKCVQARIPVVTYNSDCLATERTGLESAEAAKADPGRHCYIGTPLEDVGTLLAHRLLSQLGDAKGVVAVISGPEHPNLSVIEEAIKAYLKDTPDVTLRETVRPAVEPGAVATAIKGVLQQESNVRGWIILNPAAVPDAAAAPLDGLGGAEVVMLGFDERAMDAVGPDKVDVLVALPFVKYGSAAVEALNGMTRKHRNYPNVVRIGPDIVTIDNLERVKASRRKIRNGQMSVIVVPSGGVKPNQPSGDAAASVPTAPAPSAPVAPGEPTE